MPISKTTKRLVETNNIEQVNSIQILGITFKTGEITCNLVENTENIINRIEQQIKTWSKRNLSIIGKIIISKSFLISQCVYLMQSISIPEPVLRKINTRIFSFIWRNKYSEKHAFERLKRNILCSQYDKGGLEMINVIQMQDCFMVNWAVKFCDDPNNSNMIIPNLILK